MISFTDAQREIPEERFHSETLADRLATEQ